MNDDFYCQNCGKQYYPSIQRFSKYYKYKCNLCGVRLRTCRPWYADLIAWMNKKYVLEKESL